VSFACAAERRERADGVSRGSRTARLPDCAAMGLGQRIFFLHDGRTADLGEAIVARERRLGQTV
jgi:CxxC motif-containing protein (DUF1111 family)